MTTTLTVRPALTNEQQSAVNTYGQVFPNPLEAITNTTYRFFNPHGKVKLIFYMPASANFEITIDSIADPLGRTKNLAAVGAKKITTAGANPEIHVLGPFTPGLWTHPSGGDKDYTTFTIANASGAIKVAALYG